MTTEHTEHAHLGLMLLILVLVGCVSSLMRRVAELEDAGHVHPVKVKKGKNANA